MYTIYRRGYRSRSYDNKVFLARESLYRKKLEGYTTLMFLQLQGSVPPLKPFLLATKWCARDITCLYHVLGVYIIAVGSGTG